MCPCFMLSRGSFEPQPITVALDEKSTRNSTWQVWIMLIWIVGNFSRMALEGRVDGICGMELDLHYGLVPSNKLWAIKQPTHS